MEIDEEVVKISKKFLPFVSSSYSDRRLRLFIEDGAEFVKKSKGKYDAVLIDSTDPVGAAAVLFTEEFYRNIKNLLKKDGIIGSQTGSPFMYPGHLKMAYENMRTLFNTIKIYTAPVPTYPGAIWSFTFATNGDLKRKRTRNFRTMFYNEEYHDTNINPDMKKPRKLINRIHDFQSPVMLLYEEITGAEELINIEYMDKNIKMKNSISNINEM